jgi:hypothetical protein
MFMVKVRRNAGRRLPALMAGCQELSSVGAVGPFFFMESMAFWAEALLA